MSLPSRLAPPPFIRMQRSKALLGLSREHHEALVLARRASTSAPHGEAAEALREQLLGRWTAQFEPHFALEEDVLLPALTAAGCGADAAEALAQHTELRRLTACLRAGDLGSLALWGQAMQVHVRFEERSLFPLAERMLDLDPLAGALNPRPPAPEAGLVPAGDRLPYPAVEWHH